MAEHEATTVEVIYALPQQQRIVSVPLSEGMTAGEAVIASGLIAEYPEIEAKPLVLGLFGLEIEPDHRLRAGDRVEICRPLVQDPREMRRHVIEAGRVMGQRDDK